MIKSILIALDPDDDTSVATEYSIWLAKKFNAIITGLAIIDTSNIYTDVGGGKIDEMHYARNLWEEVSEETRRTAEQLLEKFKNSVLEADVRYTSMKKEGASFERIIEETKYHDVLLLGRYSHFFYNEPIKETKTLAKVVKNGVSPTLVVTNEYREINRVLIAFDGSIPASRSIKSFVHLSPFGKDLEIELLFVSMKNTEKEREYSKYILEKIRDYLINHGYNKINYFVEHGDKPSKVILDKQTNLNADMTILGAHSVSALRRATFGSNTHDIITKTNIPLYLNP